MVFEAKLNLSFSGNERILQKNYLLNAYCFLVQRNRK